MAGFGYNFRRPLAVTSAQADQRGYESINLDHFALDRPWRAAGTGARTILFDFGAPVAIDGVFTGDFNVASIGMHNGDTIGGLAVKTAITQNRGSNGRYRGLQRYQETKRYWQLTLNAATTDGLSYYRGGVVYFWITWLSLLPPNFGIQANKIKPQIRNTPANERIQIARVAAPLEEISMSYEHKLAEVGELANFIERAEAGTVIYDLQHSFRPAYMWPLKIVDDRQPERLDKVRLATRDIVCREVG